MVRPGDLCSCCKKREVEVIDDWVSTLCGNCADVMADRERERREFAYYHPPEKD